MRALLLVVIISTLLIARENPFKPVIPPSESGTVSEPQQPKFFSGEELRLPSSARKIKKILIEYQNLDGTVDSINKDLDNDIDWHFPIIISQDIVLDSGAENLKHMVPPQISENKKTLKPYPFVMFEVAKKNLEIITKDAKIRHFALAGPVKIVIDLKRESDFNAKIIKTDLPFFEEISIGNHKDHYRIAIKLDGKYKYDLTETSGGYRIELK